MMILPRVHPMIYLFRSGKNIQQKTIGSPAISYQAMVDYSMISSRELLSISASKARMEYTFKSKD